MLKYKEQEEKLLEKLKIMYTDQLGQYSKSKDEVKELENTINEYKVIIDSQIDEYLKENDIFQRNISGIHIEKLETLRKEFLDHLRSFEIITFNNFEKEKLYNDSYSREILEIKYKEMDKLHKNFKMREIETIREYLKTSTTKLIQKTDDILESQQIYGQIFKFYIFKRSEFGDYQETINNLKKVEEEFYEKKNKFYESRVKDSVSSVIIIMLIK